MYNDTVGWWAVRLTIVARKRWIDRWLSQLAPTVSPSTRDDALDTIALISCRGPSLIYTPAIHRSANAYHMWWVLSSDGRPSVRVYSICLSINHIPLDSLRKTTLKVGLVTYSNDWAWFSRTVREIRRAEFPYLSIRL